MDDEEADEDYRRGFRDGYKAGRADALEQNQRDQKGSYVAPDNEYARRRRLGLCVCIGDCTCQ